MKQGIQKVVIGIVGLVLLLLVSACAGVTGTGGPGTSVKITGTIQSVSAANHSVTINVNGQQYTINGLSDQQVAALQSQVGKPFTFTAVQNSDGTYTIGTGSNPQSDEGTPNVSPGIETQTPDNNGQNEPGSIDFIGKVQSSSSSSVTVSMPDGKTLTLSIVSGQTDLGDNNNTVPGVGQLVKVSAVANSDGSFMAKKIKLATAGDPDQNVVSYQGVTTSAVGSDNVIHFKVGNQSFSYTISSTTDTSDFNNNAQSIGANQTVKVKVMFQGSTGVVQKVSM